MKIISRFIDLEITKDFSSGHRFRVLIFGIVVARFVLEQGSTEIKRY
jgi:hypothetical protein